MNTVKCNKKCKYKCISSRMTRVKEGYDSMLELDKKYA